MINQYYQQVDGREQRSQYFDNPDTAGDWLIAAWKEYIISGKSMDDLLGLKTVGFSGQNARTTYFRQKRGLALWNAWSLVKEINGLSDWKASQELYRLIQRPSSVMDLELTDAINEYLMLSELLGSKQYSSAASLHRNITERYSQIADLLIYENV